MTSLGHTEKTPLLSDIYTAWKGEILFEDFFCNVNTLILWSNLAISAKQTRISIRQPILQVMLHKHLLKMSMKGYHFHSAK